MRRRLRRRLLASRRNLPVKLAAVLAAGLLWWYAASDPATTVQRSLLVPLEVTQVPSDSVVVGVPDVVEVGLSGPAARMDRVQPDDLRAALDLNDAEGEFARSVEVTVPPSLRTVRVVPNEVIGRVETLTRRELAVEVLVRPIDARVTALRTEPSTVVLEGRASVLDRVESVWAAVPGSAGQHEAAPVAVGAAGRPVTDLELTPGTVSVEVSVAEPMQRKGVALRLASSPPPGMRVTLQQERIEVVGPPEVVADLEDVSGSVGDATNALPPGRYTLAVRLDLPQDVAAFTVPLADVEVDGP